MTHSLALAAEPLPAGPAEQAAADFLTALGVDLDDESRRDTPRRMAAMYAELLTPADFHATTFPNDGGYDELVVARDIPFHSLCEHHLLPFSGRAHVAYIPNKDGRITGLSKVARVVDILAKRPQVQERLTTEIADTIEEALEPRGVFVMIEAEHLCMTMRGVKKPGAVTVTSAVRGLFRNDARTRQEALHHIGKG
jgi:GTP cyclohydrolase I